MLEALLRVLPKTGEVFVSLDTRMPIPEGIGGNVQIQRVQASIVQRFLAEKWLAQQVTPEDTVLCFGNLPPLFKLKGRTSVLVHNRYLIDDASLHAFPLKVQLRLALERWWLSSKLTHAAEFIVQTSTMQKLMEAKTQGKIPVRLLPFLATRHGYARRGTLVNSQK